jgi:hypothetical protein
MRKAKPMASVKKPGVNNKAPEIRIIAPFANGSDGFSSLEKED